MNNSHKITLAIFGNQISNSGFQPLYWINDPPQQLENLVPPGMDENLFFFTLQILPSYTQYTLIHNRVSSFMSIRQGVLKMAITIPKGYAISGGVSPLEVLLNVRGKFFEVCMTRRDIHTENFNFKEKLPDGDVFAEIVDSYELIPVAQPQPHLPMTGTDDALLLINDEAISQLFLYPQHQEFERFKRIVIANKGNASTYKAQFDGILISAEEAQKEVPPTNVQKDIADEAPQNSQRLLQEEKSDKSDKFSFFRKYRKLLPVLLFLVIGGIAVWQLLPSKKESIEADPNPVKPKPDNKDKFAHLKKEIEKQRKKLDNPELTFDEITQLATWAQTENVPANVPADVQKEFLSLENRILLYDSLQTMFAKHDYNGTWAYIRSELKAISTFADSLYACGVLTPQHYHYLRGAYMVAVPCEEGDDCMEGYSWKDDNPNEYIGMKEFLDNRDKKGRYHSFKDIFDIAIGNDIRPAPPTVETQQPSTSQSRPADPSRTKGSTVDKKGIEINTDDVRL